MYCRSKYIYLYGITLLEQNNLSQCFLFHVFAKTYVEMRKNQEISGHFYSFFFLRSNLKPVLIKPQDENIKTDLPPVRLELTAFRL